ncbi:hypothetical protein RR48_11752 [Papilio machaon]|uniref:Kazal-like domain-containing protein n=1 Tax=Papilio machaon TaxID=76193 RepID=A0A194QP03_PAPMA|nr:hypothetical protein RR48_11752 [Papilio machaon]
MKASIVILLTLGNQTERGEVSTITNSIINTVQVFEDTTSTIYRLADKGKILVCISTKKAVSHMEHIFFAATCTLCIYEYDRPLVYKKNPAPDGHRCGLCPTYYQKTCGFNMQDNTTYIFDNHCIMDLYNCFEGTEFITMNYNKCLYFGNFAYVHGFKNEDKDYGEDHFIIKGSKKNPDFVD